ncbi:MAG: hypothetical protein V2A54_05165 [Bacteroidota bacterium]
MKKLYILWFILAICLINQNAYSQKIGDLKGIYYQAVAIDEDGKEIVGMDVEGKPLYEKTIAVRFTITKGLDGVVQWEETHTTNTDKYGLFSLTIGLGAPTGNGAYAKLLDIPWIDADQFLKVEISTKNDGNYKMVSNQQFMAVPYSFYTDDIADNAITTEKILDSTIINQDIHTGAVDSRTILNETILAEDIATGAVTTSEILDSTIINQDLQTGSVDSRVILNETILAEDIATNAVTTSEILDSTIINQDIQVGAIDSRTILDGTILNQDIADGTINLTTKVTGILPVSNGGTGNSTFINDNLLVGNGINPVKSKILACRDSSIAITQTADSIILKSTYVGTEVTSDPAGTFVIGNLPNGTTYVSNAINSFTVDFGDIIVGSVDVNIQGCMMTAYVSQPNVIRVAIYNGTGSAVNLGTVNFRVYIIH